MHHRKCRWYYSIIRLLFVQIELIYVLNGHVPVEN